MKKILSLAMMLLLVFALTGCKKAIPDLSGEELFSAKGNSDGRYFIYFYRKDCEGCKEIEPVIEQYITYIKEEPEKWGDKRPVYGFDISEKSKYGKIYRVYQGIDGEEENKQFYVRDAKTWEDLYIASTPSLIGVEKVDGKVIITFIASGSDNVGRTLAEHLGLTWQDQQQQ